jgi:RNA polymerase sigma-70 factor (ECF subfamily)
MEPNPAFEAAYRQNFVRICHLARRCGVAERDVLDAAHDVFVVAWRKWGTLLPGAPVAPWLSGITIRVAAARRRRAHVVHEVLDEVDAPGSTTPHDVAMARDVRRTVVLALDTLDEEKREVLVLHDLEGFQMPEIAGATGVPLNTLYSRLRLAREQFRRAVKRKANPLEAP